MTNDNNIQRKMDTTIDMLHRNTHSVTTVRWRYVLFLLLLLLGGMVNGAWADVTYHIINLGTDGAGTDNRTEAVKCTSSETTIGLPNNFKSPLATNYKYYKTGEFTVADGVYSDFIDTPTLSEGDAVGDLTDIYVTYTYNPSEDIDLSGSTSFNIMVGGRYFASNFSRGRPETRATSDTDVTSEALKSNTTTNNYHYLWKLVGNDPYNVAVYSTYDKGDRLLWGPFNNSEGTKDNMWVNSNTPSGVTSFILLNHGTSDYVLMAANVTQPNGSNYAYLMNCNSSNGYNNPWVRFASEANSHQVQLLDPFAIPVTYHVMSGGISANNETMKVTVQQNYHKAPKVPALLADLLVDGYTLYQSDKTTEYVEGDALSTTEVESLDVYVVPNYIPQDQPVNLTEGSGQYFAIKVKVGSGYKYVYATSETALGAADEMPTDEGAKNAYYWSLTGSDPFGVTVTNKAYPDSKLYYSEIANNQAVTLSSSESSLFVLKRFPDSKPKNNAPRRAPVDPSTEAYDLYELLAATGSDADASEHIYYVGYDETSTLALVDDANYEPGTMALQLDLEKADEKEYTFHIVDRSGHLAIKATGSWPIGRGLNYYAIPEAIRSPYLQGENIRFYTTATKDDTKTSEQTTDKRAVYDLDDEITTSGPTASTPKDIYVNYDYTPEKHDVDLSGSTKYYMHFAERGYMSNYTIVGTTAESSSNNNQQAWMQYVNDNSTYPSFTDYSSHPVLRWTFVNSDPYNVQIHNDAWSAENFMACQTGNRNTNANTHIQMKDINSSYFKVLSYILMGNATDGCKLMCCQYDTDENIYFVRFPAGNTYPQKDTTNDGAALFTPEVAVTYHVINLAGKESVKGTGYVDTSEGTKKLALPEGIRSPLVDKTQFKFYTYDQFTVTDGVYTLRSGEDAITELPDGVTDIYVCYPQSSVLSTLALDGSVEYNIKIAGSYYWTAVVNNGNGNIYAYDTATDEEKAGSLYKWTLQGGDPYNIQIFNSFKNAYITLNQEGSTLTTENAYIYPNSKTSNVVQTWALLRRATSDDADGQYAIVPAVPTDNTTWTGKYWSSDFMYVNRYNATQMRANIYSNNGHNDVKIEFETSTVCTYHVINMSGREALQKETSDITTLSLPSDVRSPLATNYKYYYQNQFTATTSGDVTTYTLNEGETDLATKGITAPANQSHVFVTYEYDADAAKKMGIDLSGETLTTLFAKGPEDKNGPYLMGKSGRRGPSNSQILSSAVKDAVRYHPAWYEWRFYGNNTDKNDPYDVSIRVEGNSTWLGQPNNSDNGIDDKECWVGSNKHTLMLLNGQNGYFEIMRCMFPSVEYYQYMFCPGTNVDVDATGYAFHYSRHATLHRHLDPANQFTVQKPYIYHVVNLSGEIATHGIGSRLKVDGVTKPAMPMVITSPLIDDDKYQYYDVTQFDATQRESGKYVLKAGEQPKTYLSDFTTNDIYVIYRKADIKPLVDLTGQTSYNMLVGTADNALYTYYSSTTNDHVRGEKAPSDNTEDKYLWLLNGDDPYNIAVYNVSDPSTCLSIRNYVNSDVKHSVYDMILSNTNTYNRFLLVKGGDDSHYHLIGGKDLVKEVFDTSNARPDYYGWGFYRKYIGAVSDDELYFTNDYRQVTLTPAHNARHTYVMVNNQGQEAMRMTVDGARGVAPRVPVVMQSPFAGNWRYYGALAAAQADAGGTSLMATTPDTDGEIFVRYDRNDNTALNLKGEKYYFLKANGQYGHTNDQNDQTPVYSADTYDDNQLGYYAWQLDGGDDPYNITMRLPGLTDMALGTPDYTHANAPRRAAANHYQLQMVADGSEHAMTFAVLPGNEQSGHYALVMTAHTKVAASANVADITGNQFNYIGREADHSPGQLFLLQGDITLSNDALQIDNADDPTQITFDPVVLHYHYHILSPDDGHAVLESYTTTDADGAAAGMLASEAFPQALRRLGCPPSKMKFYASTDALTTTAQLTNAFNAATASLQLGIDKLHVYCRYEVDDDELPFYYSGSLSDLAALAAQDSPDISGLDWNYWELQNENYYLGGQDWPQLGRYQLTGTANKYKEEAQVMWAFFGDPYRTQIINKYHWDHNDLTYVSKHAALSPQGFNTSNSSSNLGTLPVSDDRTIWQYDMVTEGSTTLGSFFLSKYTYAGTEVKTESSELLVGNRYYMRLAYGNETTNADNKIHTIDELKNTILPLNARFAFHVINLSGKEVILYKNKTDKVAIGTKSKGMNSLFADYLNSTLASANYYGPEDVTRSGDTYTVKSGATDVTDGYTPTLGQKTVHIYKTYIPNTVKFDGVECKGNEYFTIADGASGTTNYLYLDIQSDGTRTVRVTTAKPDDLRNKKYLWRIVPTRATASNGNSYYDPYDIRIYNLADPDQPLAVGDYNAAITTGSEANAQRFIYQTGHCFLLANSDTDGGEPYAYLFAKDASHQATYNTEKYLGSYPHWGNGNIQFNLKQVAFTYSIYNLSGKKAIGRKVTAADEIRELYASDKLVVPSRIKSPLVKDGNWQFWKDAASAEKASGNSLSSISESDGKIFITYTYVNDVNGTLDLSGESSYNITHPIDDTYWMTYSGDYNHPCARPHVAGKETDDEYLWMLTGSDPYRVVIVSRKFPTINLGSNLLQQETDTYTKIKNGKEHIQEFIVLTSPDDPEGKDYELALATGGRTGAKLDNSLFVCQPDGTTKNNIYAYYTEATGDKAKYDAAKARLIITNKSADYIYHIINHENRKALAYSGKGIVGKRANELPQSVRSPLADNFRFYAKTDITWTESGVYTVKDGAQPMEVMPTLSNYDKETNELLPEDIYVYYDTRTTGTDRLDLAPTADGAFYFMTSNGEYAHKSGAQVPTATEPQRERYTVDNYLWRLEGDVTGDGVGDPYNVRLMLKDNSELLSADALDEGTDELTLTSGTAQVQAFCLLMGNGTAGNYTVVAASGDSITDNRFAYIGREATGGPLQLMRSDELSRTTAALQVRFDVPTFDYTYRVVNLSDQVAIQYTERQQTGTAPHLPAVIQSPFIDADQTLYFLENQGTLSADKKQWTRNEGTGSQQTLPYWNAEFYVKYQPNANDSLELSGRKRYNMLVVDDRPAYLNSGSITVDESDITDAKTKQEVYQFTLRQTQGKADPYDVTITNFKDKSKTVTGTYIPQWSNTQGRWLLLRAYDGSYTATDGDGSSGKPFQYLKADLGTTTSKSSAAKVKFEGIKVDITYVVINLAQTQSIRKTETQEGGDKPKIPTLIKSIQVPYEDFHYWKPDGVKMSNGTDAAPTSDDKFTGNSLTYDIPEGNAYTSNDYLPYSDEVVYVTYGWNGNSDYDITGRAKYNIKMAYNPSKSTDEDWRYAYATDTETKYAWVKSVPDDDKELDNTAYMWSLEGDIEGGDPYAIMIKNNAISQYIEGHTSFKFSDGDRRCNFRKKDNLNKKCGTYILANDENGNLQFLATRVNTYNSNGAELAYLTRIGKYDNDYRIGYVMDTEIPDNNTATVLTPRDIINVNFFLRRKMVADTYSDEPTWKSENVPCKTEIKMPTEWQRKYCDYKFYCRYGINGDELTTEDADVSAEALATEKNAEKNWTLERYPLVLPTEGEDTKTVNIYVDYTVNMDKANGGIPFNLLASDKEGVDNLLTGKTADGGEDVETLFDLTSYAKRKENKGHLYFLVQQVNDDFSQGSQYFLRLDDRTQYNSYSRENEAVGTQVGWLNNGYKLYRSNDQNVNQWTYSRCAESYRETDHSLFQDKRWLWAFAGDPYDLYIYNVHALTEERYNAVTETIEKTNYYPLNLMGLTTTTNTANDGTVTTTYAPSAALYTEAPTSKDAVMSWGLGNEKGKNSDKAFSLLAEVEGADGNVELRYWRMNSGVKAETRLETTTSLDYNLRVLPYEPVRYEDVNLEVHRTDEVKDYQNDPTDAKLATMKTGISQLYYSASDRYFAAGDKILHYVDGDENYQALTAAEQTRTTKYGDILSIPQQAQRQFCHYTIYSDVKKSDTKAYQTEGTYTIQAGPYRYFYSEVGKTPEKYGDITFDGYITTEDDENATPVAYFVRDFDTTTKEWKEEYYRKDGEGSWYEYQSTDIDPWPQNVYARYDVTSDIFLKHAPTQAEVKTMADQNDHVYFMDFTQDKATRGYNEGSHAYFDNEALFTQDKPKKLDTNSDGTVKTTTMTDNNGNQVEIVQSVDNSVSTRKQYRTTQNRMTSVPEHLKWYFVGDPYAVQVYCTAGEWGDDGNGNIVAANLCRFDPTENEYQYIVDCVHLRVPDKVTLDPRKYLTYYDPNSTSPALTGEVTENPNYQKPFYDDFMWEVVPAYSLNDDEFALRFKRDNVLLSYRNVYYYLARDGKTKTYVNGSYPINLSYYADNRLNLSGTRNGMHQANDADCIIRLTQPAKVFVTADRAADDCRKEQKAVVKDELSEYFGLGETISEVPRHLQRKYVKYTYPTDFPLTLDNANTKYCTKSVADSEHTVAGDSVFVGGTKVQNEFKFTVSYTVDDRTNSTDGKEVHLFTTPCKWDGGNPATARPTWVDVTTGGNHWLYFDKTKDGTTHVDQYTDDGWNTGLKGLHWAMIGDPYDFTLVNRRRWEDGQNKEAQYLVATQKTIANYKDVNDSIIWTTSLKADSLMVPETSENHTSATTATATENTRFSLQMWKVGPSDNVTTGNSDAAFFLRTASLKQTTGDGNNDSGSNETNHYWRMVYKPYTPTDATEPLSYFEAIPFSLSHKDGYYYTGTSMDNLGANQQQARVRTAVAKDEDHASNDCFDADIEIRSKDGDILRITQQNMEIRYGDVIKSLPVTLQRYGCTYKCYLNYGTSTQVELKTFREKSDTESTNASIKAEAKNLQDALDAALAAGRHVKLTYVYTVTDEVQSFFTTEADAKTEDYTWMNTYYRWTQYITGTNVEVTRYRDVHDHYVYSEDGHIIDEVFRKEPYTDYIKGTNIPYESSAYLNSHDGQKAAYADQGVQTESDRQKWALVGDPYSFQMKNYAAFLLNHNSVLTTNGDKVENQNLGEGQALTIIIDAKGTPYLGIVDTNPDSPTYGQVIKCVGFADSDKSLLTTGNGVDTSDPTGNSLSVGKSKPFFLASLIRYADVVVYHLVIAHQHSLDADDLFLKDIFNDKLYSKADITDREGEAPSANFGTADEARAFMWQARQTVRRHLIEYLKYRGIEEDPNGLREKYYLTISDSGNDTTLNAARMNDIKTLLKDHASLRDLVSFPIADEIVSKVGIGNRPQLPWYMRRQFCDYKLYQRDVQRSVVNTNDPIKVVKNGDSCYVWVNETLGRTDTIPTSRGENYYQSPWYKACNVTWVSVLDKNYWTNGEEPRGYDAIVTQNGHVLEKFDESHYNRKVIIDVVYDVNPQEFRFADAGRNTTAWYTMMTNNATDGLMNFSYKDGVGARRDRTAHYTNNYLWAPEGDPYGFVMRSRYATINGTGWDDVVVTTTGQLPKASNRSSYVQESGDAKYRATYTSKSNTETENARFVDKRIVHLTKGMMRTSGTDKNTQVMTDGAANAIYEMFRSNYDNSFLMHPTAAWIDTETNTSFDSYYMVHNTDSHQAQLQKRSGSELRDDGDASWRLVTTAEQLLPYFDRSGYVGGLEPSRLTGSTVNQNLRSTLRSYVDNPKLAQDFAVLDAARKLVYSGTFYKNDGVTEVKYTDERPAAKDLPMKFVSTNLVNMKRGYYRIEAFSRQALDADGGYDAEGKPYDLTDKKRGVVGPRFISGYRHLSEKADQRWLHFYETDDEHATMRTFQEMEDHIKAIPRHGDHFAIAEHPALKGNIELLPAEYDPSSIFYFDPDADDTRYGRYHIRTQGLELYARPGKSQSVDATNYGHTLLIADDETAPSAAYDNLFRLADIGGTAVTMRTMKNNNVEADWDNIVADNLKTNYLCIDSLHRYRITIHEQNEMVEIGEHSDGLGTYGIQDTKWMLKPVGQRTQWPYNQMPLRVEVQKGGVNQRGQDDQYSYGSLYVPFPARLANTADGAFTAVAPPKMDDDQKQGTINLSSVSLYNQMSNPQYIPTAWPVVLRTNNAKTGADDKKYVELYLPYDDQRTVANDKILLEGRYLEQTLTDISELTQTPSVAEGSTDKRVLVFGLPWDENAHSNHEYNYKERVGFYTNENWAREGYSAASARSATDDERDNRYVYHNRVFYVYTPATTSGAPRRQHIIALFDEDDDDEPDDPGIEEGVVSSHPWPCDVYDLQGRRVAENETPYTLRKNHPSLQKGVYIFGGHKVVVR